MKNAKLLSLLLITGSLIASGCNNKDELESLRIITPTGAPALAFYNYSNNTNFDTNSVPANIVAMLPYNSYDVVALPTNVCVQAIVNKKVNYKLAATITFGNIFVASTGNDDDGVMDENDYIVSFQRGGVPDKIFHYVYGNKYDSTLHYVESVSEAQQCLKSGLNTTELNKPKVDYVVVAEPTLHAVLSSTEGRSEYANLQQLYKEKSGGLEIYQASIMVSNNLSKDVADAFLASIKKDIEDAIEDPDKMFEGLTKNDNAQVKYGVNPQVAKAVTQNNNRMGLGYKLAKPNKEAIDLFLSLFNMEATNEEIYY